MLQFFLLYVNKSTFRPTTSTNAVKFVPSNRRSSLTGSQRASDDYIQRLNINLSFSREVVSESAPSALRFEQIHPSDIYSAPKALLTGKKSVVNKGIQGRHNAIGDPIPHLPCTLTGKNTKPNFIIIDKMFRPRQCERLPHQKTLILT